MDESSAPEVSVSATTSEELLGEILRDGARAPVSAKASLTALAPLRLERYDREQLITLGLDRRDIISGERIVFQQCRNGGDGGRERRVLARG